MPTIDRIPGQDTRTRRAFAGIGVNFVPYTGAIYDVNLGAFNFTTTGIVTAANLVLSDKNGIDFTHATDEDVDIIELSGITGDPKMYWDESEDRFRFTKGLFVDVNVGILGSASVGTTLNVTGLATVGELDVDTLNLSGNVISDSTGTISFDNEHLITTGKITGLLQMGQNLTPTYTTVQHWSDLTQSACVLTGGVISDSGGLEIDVSAATGIIKTTASEIGANVFFNYAGELNVATVAGLNFVYLAYVDTDNAPTLHTTTDRTTINDQTEILIGWAYNDGAALHILNLGHRFQNHNARNRCRVRDVRGFERSTGIVVSTDATRHVLSTEGIIYRYVDKITVALFDSTVGGGDTFSYWYRDGVGGWTEVTGQTVINNANYDDGVPPLGALGANRYGVHWVYVSPDSHVHIIYGRGNYKMAEAEDATPPSDIPDIIEHMTILAAKIIVKVATDITTVASAFDIAFSATGVDNHNDLGGIQGGAADDYYHFTTVQHTDLTDAGDSALHYHATDRARANHTGTQLAATISDFSASADARISAASLNDLGDVNAGAPADNDSLTWDAGTSKWIPEAVAAGAMEINRIWMGC